jgi:hypothetical protein
MSEKTDKIKKHFRDHKEAYITGGVCLVVGAAVTYLVMKGDDILASDESVKLINAIHGNTVNGDMHNTIITILERRGHPGNMVLCKETGEVFASQARAAAANGISGSSLSQHLAGLKDSVKGLTFENLGEMT